MDEIFTNLPQLQPAPQSFQLKETDIFVTAGGFEDRSQAFPAIVVAEKGAHAVILEYIPFDVRNRTNEIKESLKKSGAAVEVIGFNRWDGDEAWSALFGAISRQADTHRRVVIDISGLSKFGIWLSLEAAKQVHMDVFILYAEAGKYGPTFEEYRKAKESMNIMQPSLQVYSGVQDVIRSEILSSVSMQGQPICLIAFMSFNENFVQTLLNRINPGRLSLINGRPPVHTWREEATAWIHRRLLDEWPSDNRQSDGLVTRTTSTLDYRETLCAVLEIYWNLFASHRIVISPSGSKMQAVGAYLVRALHPDMHTESPVAKGYLDEYSSGVGKMWTLDLGEISVVLRKLRMYELSKYLMPDADL